jgi:hypothetical protein
MTNRELLNLPALALDSIDQQRRYLLRLEGVPMPCPACRQPVNVFDAARINVDAYDFGVTRYDFRCPGCSAELEQIIPLVAFGRCLWHWELKNSWLQEQFRKARAFDEQASAPGQ